MKDNDEEELRYITHEKGTHHYVKKSSNTGNLMRILKSIIATDSRNTP